MAIPLKAGSPKKADLFRFPRNVSFLRQVGTSEMLPQERGQEITGKKEDDMKSGMLKKLREKLEKNRWGKKTSLKMPRTRKS
jgi:hypothetical protein